MMRKSEHIIDMTKEKQTYGVFDEKEIVLDYDIICDCIDHKSDLITVVFGLPQRIEHARDYLIRYGIIQPESTKDFMELFRSIRSGAPYAECVVRTKTANGELLWVQMMLTTIFEDQQPIRAVGVFKDITRKRENELQWDNSMQHRDIMMRESNIYYEANLTKGIVSFGMEHFLKMMKIAPIDSYDHALQVLVANVVYPKERSLVRTTFSTSALLESFQMGKRCVELEYRRLSGDGNVMWVHGSAYLAKSDLTHDILLFFCATDITDLKIREVSLRERAEKDPLTGLYNKAITQMWIQDAIDLQGAQESCALLVISLMNFKRINDRMGRYFGDALLSEVGHKLLEICSKQDIVGRNAGVEFLIYLRSIHDIEEARTKAEHIYQALYQDQSEILAEANFSISIGIALCPQHGTSFEELYSNASIAVTACSYHKKHIMFYDSLMQNTVEKITQIEFDKEMQTSFDTNITEYVFRILYESKDLNATIQGVLELITRRFGFDCGYIYTVAADGSAHREFETREDSYGHTIDFPPLASELLTYYQTFFSECNTHIFQREDLSQHAAIADDLVLRFLHSFKRNMRFSGFVGFDYHNKKESLSSEKIAALKSVTQLLDVFLAGRSVNQELGESTLLLQSIVDGLHNYTYIVDPDTHLIKYVNRNTQQGLPEAKPGSICYEVLRDRSSPCTDCPIERMVKNHVQQDRSEMFLNHYGVWARINASLITVNGGQRFGVFTGFDFSEHRHENIFTPEDLGKFTMDTSLYDALSMSTDDYIVICDMKTNYYYFPKKMVEEFDLPKQVMKDAIPMWVERVHDDDKVDFMKDITTMMTGKSDTHNQEYRVLNSQGNWVWLRARGHVERSEEGEATMFVVVLTNLGKKSKVDHLTGLLDKYEFEVSTRAELAQGCRQGVMLLLGLDNFRYINSIYGWDFGDSVLKEASLRMVSTLESHIQLYRLDGDKFGAFFPNGTIEKVKEYYQTLFHMFHQHRQFGEHRYYCTISGGCSYYQGEDVSFGVLFKRATFALDCAKRDGKNRITVYDEHTMGGNERLLQVMALLNESVEQGCKWFEVYYQPQIEPSSYALKSAEALLRWKPPELGMISPAEFIPLLEQTGLIHKVGRWVLQQAGDVCKRWRKYDPTFTISVNLSFAQLQDQSFLPYLTTQVEQGNIDPQLLHLEITESCIADGSRSLKGALKVLRNLGFLIEMDDFGTGYSSLEILKNAPADVVKIDHAFVKDITRSQFDATFITFVVTLCHSVHIKVCLEGVERWDEYQLVEPMQLDIIQGFLFGKPQSSESFEKKFFLKKEETKE